MVEKRDRVYQAFGAFLSDLVIDLNHLAEERWAVLVEGPRDRRALLKLGFSGTIATISVLSRKGAGMLRGCAGVVIMTDLDREGAVLASRFVRSLGRDGFKTSLKERRRLKAASRGVFLHIENLGRFAKVDLMDPSDASPLSGGGSLESTRGMPPAGTVP